MVRLFPDRSAHLLVDAHNTQAQERHSVPLVSHKFRKWKPSRKEASPDEQHYENDPPV